MVSSTIQAGKVVFTLDGAPASRPPGQVRPNRTSFTQPIVFPNAFNAPPTVICGLDDTGFHSRFGYTQSMASKVTEAGFDAGLKVISPPACNDPKWGYVKGGSEGYYWIAIQGATTGSTEVQSGTIQFSIKGWPFDLNNPPSYLIPVTFPRSFSAAPAVVCSLSDAGPYASSAYLTCMALGISTSQFTAHLKLAECNDYTAIKNSTVTLSWIAAPIST